MAGMNPMAFYRSKDSMERNFMLAVADECHRRRDEERKDLAAKVANAVGKAFGGK